MNFVCIEKEHMKLLYFLFDHKFFMRSFSDVLLSKFQKIVFPPEKEADASAARVQENSICGTIWSMSFISKDPSQSSKGHNPVLAVLLNRYDCHACLG